MPQLQNKDVLKVELFTVGEFATAQNVSHTAAYSAIKANLVDSFVIGSKVFICNTTLTRQYKPNESPRRKKATKSKKRKGSLAPCTKGIVEAKPCKPAKNKKK